METDFKYIKNRIGEYKKQDLLEFCYDLLESKKDEEFPIWYIFIIMKWTYIFGGEKYPPKQLTQERFARIYNATSNFNQGHISAFLKDKRADKAFQILYNQQFYLQKSVTKEIYATQLKLYSKLKSKYDIEKSFKEKTGLSILDFLFIEQIVWLYINIKEAKIPNLYFDGFLEAYVLNMFSQIMTVDKIANFLSLLTLNPNNVNESISNFKHKLKTEELQTMEMSFFTMFPFQIYKDRIKLIHERIYNHTVNYYIFDFLKTNDEKFTTEFGYRLEKYIGLGLTEIAEQFKTETELKKILPAESKLVDFMVGNNIFIESKATEIQAYPNVNPTDELIFTALESSVFKAYFEQLLTVSKTLNPNSENWGIIITYKELFWSHFTKLFDIGKDRYKTSSDYLHLPPENVFIIDIYTWDKVVQIVKDKKATLLEILQIAKKNNSSFDTSKQLFGMHLDIYYPMQLNLSYLQTEISELNIK